jgi:hypothetical protein
MRDQTRVFWVFKICSIICFDICKKHPASVEVNQLNTLNYILQSTTQSLDIFIVWFYCIQTCLLPYWRWSGSERKIVAPWGWHCFAETCRSHRIKKNKYIIQWIYLVNLYVVENARYKKQNPASVFRTAEFMTSDRTWTKVSAILLCVTIQKFRKWGLTLKTYPSGLRLFRQILSCGRSDNKLNTHYIYDT